MEGRNYICGIIEVTALARQLRAHPLQLVIQDIHKALLTHRWVAESSYFTLVTKYDLGKKYEASSIDPHQ